MKTIVLLHGAIGASDQLEPLKESLSENFRVFTMDFAGHGKRSQESGQFSIENFAKDLDEFLIRNAIEHPIIFGYSMGGYVAIYHALHFTNKAEQIVTLGTKLEWTMAIAEREIKMLDAKTIEEKVPKFAQQLRIRHGELEWKILLEKTANMMLAMGKINPLTPAQFAELKIPVSLGRGDSDMMVSQEETDAFFNANPSARRFILADTAHPIEKVNIPNLARLIQLELNE